MFFDLVGTGIMYTSFLHALPLAYTYSQDHVNISGQLLMLDDVTPHVACVVQVIAVSPGGKSEPIVVKTVLSNSAGKYRFTSLSPGTSESYSLF